MGGVSRIVLSEGNDAHGCDAQTGSTCIAGRRMLSTECLTPFPRNETEILIFQNFSSPRERAQLFLHSDWERWYLERKCRL